MLGEGTVHIVNVIHGKNQTVWSRLDYILLSDHLMWHFDDTDILPGYWSFYCYAQAQIWERYKANTFWKFNCSLLRDKDYLEQVNTEIQNVTDECAAGHYDPA